MVMIRKENNKKYFKLNKTRFGLTVEALKDQK